MAALKKKSAQRRLENSTYGKFSIFNESLEFFARRNPKGFNCWYEYARTSAVSARRAWKNIRDHYQRNLNA